MRLLTVDCLREVARAYSEDKIPRLASSIAYSTMFSIAPLFIVLIAITGWFIGLQHGGHGHRVAQEALVGGIERLAGSGSGAAVAALVNSAFEKPRANLIAEIVGWIAFIVGASAVFSSLQDALNTIFHVESTKGGWRQMLRDRGAAFGMILVVGFLLSASLAASVVVSALWHRITALNAILAAPALATGIGALLLIGVLTVLFAALYKTLPDVTLSWRDTWVGASITSVLFVAGEAIITLYLRTAGVGSAYGAAGSLLVTLIWIYYSVTVLLLGAEFTKVLADRPLTTAPVTVRKLEERPAGSDPRA